MPTRFVARQVIKESLQWKGPIAPGVGADDGDTDGNSPTLFASITPTPVAAASLGQVYKATTHEGVEVAVKVQRPDALAILAKDYLCFVVTWKGVEQYWKLSGKDIAISRPMPLACLPLPLLPWSFSLALPPSLLPSPALPQAASTTATSDQLWTESRARYSMSCSQRDAPPPSFTLPPSILRSLLPSLHVRLAFPPRPTCLLSTSVLPSLHVRRAFPPRSSCLPSTSFLQVLNELDYRKEAKNAQIFEESLDFLGGPLEQ